MSSPASSAPRGGSAPAGASDRFPPGIPYIVGNEGAERFSFYGMRQILYIYLTSLFIGFAAESAVAPDQLAEAKVHATQVVHLFNAGVYLFPMIGAILADRLLGKYRVIFWVSLIYCAGNAAMALAGHLGTTGALHLTTLAAFGGLILIALGSGGIKPCVSANVGDQFTAENAHLVTRIFQIFYFIINFGSFFASLLTPYLFQRFGPAVAFGVPGVLMAVATLVFWLGRRRFVHVPARPGGRLGLLDFLASSFLASPLLVMVVGGATVAERVVRSAMSPEAGALAAAARQIAAGYWPAGLLAAGGFAVGAILFVMRQRIQQDTGFFATLLYCRRRRRARKPGEDFWAPARSRFGDEVADGPPAVLRIIVVFSMVSVFWALFDQHSSTWIEQAKAMDLTLTVPAIFWQYGVLGGLAGVTMLGGVWLFLWVANRRPPRWLLSTCLAVVAAGELAALAGQLAVGRSETITLLPAQIAAMNPLLVMAIIPLLNILVYRPLERRGRPLPPLRRMTAGMFLAALAFVVAALLQARVAAAGPGQVHVLWQIIQFLILTTAEVLVSVTGLEFAYTQAPRAMKSTIMGFWLLCVTFGNVLVAFLAPLETLSLATFFWVFAGLMAGAATVFALLASRYRGQTYLQHA